MSSRWPRPIGIIASMALVPVASGTDTDLRSMTPAACLSIGMSVVFLNGPLPSMGSPSALTTRPRSSSLDGTERIFPLDLTVMPSDTRAVSPRMVARTPSSSRFKMRPYNSPCASIEPPSFLPLPSSKTSTSLMTALESPSMATTPSPTATTRPTCSPSCAGAIFPISLIIFSTVAESIMLLVVSASNYAVTRLYNSSNWFL